MAFNQEPVRTPTAIRDVRVDLFDGVIEGQSVQKADFTIIVQFDDGSTVQRSGDLAPHIEPQERQALMDFMADLRVQAENEIL